MAGDGFELDLPASMSMFVNAMKPRDSRSLRGASGHFLLAMVLTFPVVVPFPFATNPARALRLSHAIALGG